MREKGRWGGGGGGCVHGWALVELCSAIICAICVAICLFVGLVSICLTLDLYLYV